MSRDRTGAPGSSDGTTVESPRATGNALDVALARAARVAELRQAVAAGRYHPDPRRVAAALLKSRARQALFGDDH